MKFKDSLNTIWIVSAFLMLCSCSPEKQVDRSSMQEEVRSRELIRMSDAEVVAAAFALGSKYIQVLTPADHNKADSLGVTLLSASLKDDLANPALQGMLEAYRYAHVNGLKLDDHAEMVGRDSVVFVSPDYEECSKSYDSCKIWLLKLAIKDVVLSTQ
ncbi:MAG: hypothetical protein KI790_15805 [Cyclobacteriaceae bacterium]|nr:hypothetical protein [Cyclobacteriaceae bacterium HetDA_MAG_MS6]